MNEKDVSGTYEFKVEGIRTDISDPNGPDLLVAKRNLSYVEYGILATVTIAAVNRAYLKMSGISGLPEGEAVVAGFAAVEEE